MAEPGPTMTGSDRPTADLQGYRKQPFNVGVERPGNLKKSRFRQVPLPVPDADRSSMSPTGPGYRIHAVRDEARAAEFIRPRAAYPLWPKRRAALR